MNKPRAYVGIDPGAKGSFCCIVPDDKLVGFFPTNGKPQEIHAWLMKIHNRTNLQIIMIEDVHAIFGTSAKSNFSFGFNTGGVNWISAVIGCGVDHVAPKKWQSSFGLKTPKALKGTARKRHIKQAIGDIAERLYPQANVRGPKGGLLDGKSDSLLIAHYARRLYP